MDCCNAGQQVMCWHVFRWLYSSGTTLDVYECHIYVTKRVPTTERQQYLFLFFYLFFRLTIIFSCFIFKTADLTMKRYVGLVYRPAPPPSCHSPPLPSPLIPRKICDLKKPARDRILLEIIKYNLLYLANVHGPKCGSLSLGEWRVTERIGGWL